MRAGLVVGVDGHGAVMGKSGQKWAGLDKSNVWAGMGDMASGWVWVGVQV